MASHTWWHVQDPYEGAPQASRAFPLPPLLWLPSYGTLTGVMCHGLREVQRGQGNAREGSEGDGCLPSSSADSHHSLGLRSHVVVGRTLGWRLPADYQATCGSARQWSEAHIESLSNAQEHPGGLAVPHRSDAWREHADRMWIYPPASGKVRTWRRAKCEVSRCAAARCWEPDAVIHLRNVTHVGDSYVHGQAGRGPTPRSHGSA